MNYVKPKKVIVIRLGAYGDVAQMTPIFRFLKEDGYHVTFYCKWYGKEVVLHDPNIDRFIVHDDKVPIETLPQYLEKEITPGYDRVMNLSSVIENGLLKLEGSIEFNWPHKKRHENFNKNYSDALMEKAGYGDKKGLLPELYFTQLERTLARHLRRKYNGKFIILWSLSGSAFHKTYPYTEYVADALYKHKDIEIFTVGGAFEEMLEWHNDRTHNYSNKWTFRKSMIMAKYADLVIGTETGILNVASAFDTPKIILLSHSSQENLTKYWTNTTNLWADVHCQPCHCLNRTMRGCDKDGTLGTPICMSSIQANTVYNAVMNVYNEWRSKWGQSSVGEAGHYMRKTAEFTGMTENL